MGALKALIDRAEGSQWLRWRLSMAALKALVERVECAKGFRTYCIDH
jgi:hypothetical protein